MSTGLRIAIAVIDVWVLAGLGFTSKNLNRREKRLILFAVIGMTVFLTSKYNG